MFIIHSHTSLLWLDTAMRSRARHLRRCISINVKPQLRFVWRWEMMRLPVGCWSWWVLRHVAWREMWSRRRVDAFRAAWRDAVSASRNCAVRRISVTSKRIRWPCQSSGQRVTSCHVMVRHTNRSDVGYQTSSRVRKIRYSNNKPVQTACGTLLPSIEKIVWELHCRTCSVNC